MAITIDNRNSFGKLSLPELEDFEKVNNRKLPEDYRSFLLESNGGVPRPNLRQITGKIVSCFLGMHNGPDYSSLYRAIESYSGRLPYCSFPIASDPFGNLFIMSLEEDCYGYIYFWDHENESPVTDGHYVKNCHFEAYSFSDFINELK
jgi:hypothetical protein